MEMTGATFGRSDVGRLLGIPQTGLAIYTDPRRPYRLFPTARRAKGRGKKGLYGLGDVYKIALADKMTQLGLEASIVGEILRELFRHVDPIKCCVHDRPKEWQNVR